MILLLIAGEKGLEGEIGIDGVGCFVLGTNQTATDADNCSDGLPGPAGAQGPPGDPGLSSAGPKGDQGRRGRRGLRGYRGPKGVQGIQVKCEVLVADLYHTDFEIPSIMITLIFTKLCTTSFVSFKYINI